MDYLIPSGFEPHMGALITTLLVLYMVGKAWVWWTDRGKASTMQTALTHMEAATRSAAEAAGASREAAESAAEGLQVAKESRAISSETRQLVRDLRESGIRQGMETERILASMDKLTGSVGDLVAEIRASRRAA